MCGRFALSVDVTTLAEEFPWVSWPEELSSSYNIAPRQDIPVMRNDGNHRLEMMRWGLIPFWAKDESIGDKLINARSETLAEKPSFKHAFKRRRCAILSSGYFEWVKGDDGKKTPVFIRPQDRTYFFFAGLWEAWKPKDQQDAEKLHSCTIITTSPTDFLKKFHHRMPVILPSDQSAIDRWLHEGEVDPASLEDFFEAPRQMTFEAFPVSRQVNNPRNNSEDNLQKQGDLFSE